MLYAVEVGGVGLALIAGSEVREIALDVAGCSAASRGGETYVGRHDCCF